MVKKVMIVVTAFLLLLILSMSAMAEKGSGSGTVVWTKATSSNASRKKATASNAKKEEELDDGEIENDLPAKEDGGEEEQSDSSEKKAAEKTDVKAEADKKAAEEKKTVEEKKAAAEDLTGTWTVDSVTSYLFEEDGTGVLIVPEHEYPFRYTVDENELALEFDSRKVRDAAFSFTRDGDILILERKEEAGTAEYSLDKT